MWPVTVADIAPGSNWMRVDVGSGSVVVAGSSGVDVGGSGVAAGGSSVGVGSSGVATGGSGVGAAGMGVATCGTEQANIGTAIKESDSSNSVLLFIMVLLRHDSQFAATSGQPSLPNIALNTAIFSVSSKTARARMAKPSMTRLRITPVSVFTRNR